MSEASTGRSALSPLPLFEDVSIEPTRVRVRAAEPLSAAFLAAELDVAYPADIDLTTLPRSIALLPAVYALAPVAWVSGGTYRVDGLDTRTETALAALRSELRRTYPALPWSGDIVVDGAVDIAASPEPKADATLLFSTGVDSTCAALRHSAEQLVLVTVGLDDDLPVSRWEADMAEARRFAGESGYAHVEVRTNVRSFVGRAIGALDPTIRPWWPRVAHGMAYIGVAAPVAHRYGCPTLYIAATHSEGFERPWGSSPELDPLVAIGPTKVVHDAYELSRHARVETIVRELGRDGRTFALRVCYQQGTPEGVRNCGVCEKCVRTQVSLFLTGADPRAFGFPDYEWSVCEGARTAFEARVWKIDNGIAIYWRELSEAASTRLKAGTSDDTREFLEWLSGFHAEVTSGTSRKAHGRAEPPPTGPLRTIRRRIGRCVGRG